MGIAKKTGLYIAPVNQGIVEEVMNKYGYTKISNAINFILQEYDRLTKEEKRDVVEGKDKVFVEEGFKKVGLISSDWFVAEDK